MSRRDVVQEGERRGEHVPDEKDNLVELNRASTVEHPPHVDPVSVSEDIKDKQEQTNSTKPSSSNRYLAVFQWILLIFCVLSNIYLLSKPEIKCECDGSSADSLVTNPSPLPTASPQVIPSLLTTSLQPSSQPITDHDPTDGPSVVSSKDPTLPTIAPSFHPTMMPTSRPTSSPSMQPSEYPSQSPTYFDGYFIADYKYSFRNASHGFWVLCHGQWLDITQYSMLFNEIGYQFGSKHDQNTNILYFRLPDARDGVMGVIGSLHQMNEHVGNETHLLSQSEIAEHDHYIVSNQGNEACTSVSNTGSSLSHSCFDTVNTDYAYTLQRSPGTPNLFQTSMVGGNQSFSVMQPTKFIGNLFMYSGIMH
eukprot:438647_1